MQAHFGGVEVYLDGDQFVPVAALQPGSYLVAVTAKVPNGPTCTFAVSKSSHDGDASVQKMTSSSGFQGVQLELNWPVRGKLCMRKTGLECNGRYVVDMNLKNFLGGPAPHSCDDSIATREYVEEQINQRVQAHFSGIEVILIGDQFTSVTALQPGSYIIEVTSIVPNGPTGTFAISKSSRDGDASVQRMTSCSGAQGEQIEVHWPVGGKLEMRKTGGTEYDGRYVVNMNLKNLSAAAPVVDAQSGVYNVQLEGTTIVSLLTSLHGSFAVHVTPVEDGPAASFVITKSNSRRAASVYTQTETSGDPTVDTSPVTQLLLTWPEDSTMCLAKTSGQYDGTYEVKIL